MQALEEKQISWGIIGAGIIAEKFAGAVIQQPESRLAAVASKSLERAKSFAEKLLSKKPVSPVYIYVSSAISVATTAIDRYVPRGRNELHTIFERHFDDFCEHYDEKYVATYGR